MDRVARRLKLRDLRLLEVVVQWGSMARAAAHLNLSQAAVSKAVAELEHTLGVSLLDRSRRGVEPTIYGRALLKSGVAVFDDLRQGVKQIEFLADPTAGELQIGCTEAMAAGFVAAVVDRLSQRYPRIVFHVTQADIDTLQHRELRGRKVDLIIGRLYESMPEDIEADLVYPEQLLVTAGVDSRWASRRRIELAELVNEPWTLPPGDSAIGSLVAEAFRASGLDLPQAKVVCFSIQMHNALVATGRYLSMLSASMLRFTASRVSIKALPIDLPIKPRPVAIMTMMNRTISPVARLFIECAHEVAKPLVK